MAREYVTVYDEPPPLDEQHWIGTGKFFPSDRSSIPPDLEGYYRGKLSIPDDFRTCTFPHDKLTIDAFLNLSLPIQSYALVHPPTSTCFSLYPPNEDVNRLITRALPSRQFVNSMSKAFGQQLLNGSLSVEDPSYKMSRLPLWVVQYWLDMYSVVDAQATWRKCLAWLDAHAELTATFPAVQQARARLLLLPWNGTLGIPGASTAATTRKLTRLLGDEELCDTLIDMMVSHLSKRAQEDPNCQEVTIETLRFVNDITKVKSASEYHQLSTRVLQRLEERVIAGSLRTLYFPAYLEAQRHWLSFKLNFEAKELSYGKPLNAVLKNSSLPIAGDSLSHRGMPPPGEIVRKLQWLEKRLNGPFKNLGDSLPHGRQQDATSCGICSPNTISHNALGDPMWTCSRGVYERVNWFNILCELRESNTVRYIHQVSAGIEKLTMPTDCHRNSRHLEDWSESADS
ncbi:hypothetical protein Hypma_009978 [Hypsizygus marmoreus]|uniref:Uncharacterized protein n=1 Tax=Hypsizygus marmoreus TaxID=39966 RepID=A0A369JLR1_HYPMA|nr:hypothetical protein Hypma_009978 [Hypsizygus marmoreus]